tara:strand:+ start:93 stop:290 length:198 start_codon:yes stop_codon:yes gene_type:complete
MTEHQLEKIHNYTKYKVTEALIKRHQKGNTLSNLEEVEDVADDILRVLAICGLKFYSYGKGKSSK